MFIGGHLYKQALHFLGMKVKRDRVRERIHLEKPPSHKIPHIVLEIH